MDTHTPNAQKYVTVKGPKRLLHPQLCSLTEHIFIHSKILLLFYPFTHYTTHTVFTRHPITVQKTVLL